MNLSIKHLLVITVYFSSLYMTLLIKASNDFLTDSSNFKYYPPKDSDVVQPIDTRLIKTDTEFNRIYFTGINKLYSTTFDLTDIKEYDLTPTQEITEKCWQMWRTNQDQNCKNIIKILEFDLDRNIFVCGTYGFSPKCWTFSRTADGLTEIRVSTGYNRSPEIVDVNATIVFSEPYYFVATKRNYDFGIRKFKPSSDSVSVETTKKNPNIFLEPHFVSSYGFENSNYVYFFFYEHATENTERKSIYSRVGRVCKNDQGDVFGNDIFTTFLKSQLKCFKKGSPLDFFYDELRSTTLVKVHDISSDHVSEYIYAVFATADGSGGSALCRYKVKDIIHVFDTSPLFKYDKDSTWTKVDMNDERANLSRPSCDKDVFARPNKELNEAKEQPLLFDDIVPTDGQALFVDKEKSLTSIVVDDFHLLPDISDVSMHLIFMGTQNGEVLKVSINSSGKGSSKLVETLKPFEGHQPILQLKKNQDTLYAVSTTGVSSFLLQRCADQVTCSRCVELKDPYCAWSISLKKCAPVKSLEHKDRLMNLYGDDTSMCPKEKSYFSCDINVLEYNLGLKATLQCNSFTNETNVQPKIVAWKFNKHPLVHNINKGVVLTPSVASSKQSLEVQNFSSANVGLYECIVKLDNETKVCSTLLEVAATSTTSTTTDTSTTTITSTTTATASTGKPINIVISTLDNKVDTPPKQATTTPGTPLTGKKSSDSTWYREFVVMTVLCVMLVVLLLLILCVICYYKRENKENSVGDDSDGKHNGHANGHALKIPFTKKYKMNRKDSANKELIKKNNTAQVYKDTTLEMNDVNGKNRIAV